MPPLPLPLMQLEMKLEFTGYINQFFINEGNKHKCIFLIEICLKYIIFQLFEIPSLGKLFD